MGIYSVSVNKSTAIMLFAVLISYDYYFICLYDLHKFEPLGAIVKDGGNWWLGGAMASSMPMQFY